MKKCVLFFLFVLIISKITVAQKKAITDNGDEVILYDNGTWKYTKEFIDTANFIKTNPVAFYKPKNANFLLKSTHAHVGFWIDTKKWTFGKATSNKSAEYELQNKNETMQVEVITEKIALPLTTLRKIAIKNAKAAAPDWHIVKEEYRTVNGLKVLFIQSEGTISDIHFIFYSYYYTDASSSTQFLVLGSKDANNFSKEDAENLLNGIVVTDADGSNLSSVPDEEVKVDVKSPLSQDSPQGNYDCKKYFAGKWQYTSQMQRITVERTLDKSVEQIGNHTYEYSIKWLDNCKYQLIFKSSDDPNYEVPDKPMIVDILGIDNQTMEYEAMYNGQSVKNEMIKVK